MSDEPRAFELEDDGTVPNNAGCPLLVYADALPGVLDAADPPAAVEERFARNDWTASWRNGVYPFHHYHSTSHEVLGCYRGEATVQFGGDHGVTLTLSAGDVVVIPAGVAHKRISASADFGVVGAYPGGREWDMNYAKAEEREQALANIARVPLPEFDPLYGPDGPIREIWSRTTRKDET